MKKKIIITLASSALMAGGTACSGAPGTNAPGSTSKPTAHVSAAHLATMNKAEVKKLLATLEKSKAPDPKMGAMCYSPAVMPPEWQYVCPICGEKSLYSGEISGRLSGELLYSRRVFKQIPKREGLTLEESGFCRKCQPTNSTPVLKLIIRYDDGTTNITSGISSDDLQLLKGFFSGNLSFGTSNEGKDPLKPQLLRLRQLLGIKHE